MLSVKEIVTATNGKLLNGRLDRTITQYKIDSREVNKGDFYIPLIGEKVDGHKFINDVLEKECSGFFISNYDYIDILSIKNKYKDVVIIEVENTLEALQKIGIYNRNKHLEIEVIAITGSVGKTSTREMIASVLSEEKNLMVTQKNMNGHIGLPIMALQLEEQDMAILEAGIDFCGEMDILNKILQPNVAVITNIGTSHIGKLGSQETIYNEKTKIANNMIGKKILLLNKDDKYLNTYKNDNVNIMYYSINEAKNVKIFDNHIKFDSKIYDKYETVKINTLGEQNILNAIVAIKVAQIYNISRESILNGISKYNNFSRRMEKIDLNGITLIDDTYNASLTSAESGLKSVDHMHGKRKIAFLADILELGEFAKEIHIELGKVFKELNYDILIAYGDNIKYTAEVAKKYINNVYVYNDIEKAENKVREIMTDGDIIYFKGSNAMNINSIIENIKRDFMN